MEMKSYRIGFGSFVTRHVPPDDTIEGRSADKLSERVAIFDKLEVVEYNVESSAKAN